jgi:osmotically-inducible protein OsmY
MFRFLSRSRRLAALLTAGILGTPPLTAGLLPFSRPAATAPAQDNRVKELQIELAWMGDPVTFRCPIRAQCTDSGVELTGFVSTAGAHKRAVQLAGKAWGGMVHDSIHVTKVSYDTFASVKSADVVHSATTAISDVLGLRVKGIEVKASNDGKVTLSGTVASWQEKYTLSTRMRRISGCSCVVNQLEVSATKEVAAKTPPHTLADLLAKPLPAPQPAPRPRSVIQRVAGWVSPYGAQQEATSPEKVIASTETAKTPSRPIVASPYGGGNMNSAPNSSQKGSTLATTSPTVAPKPTPLMEFPVSAKPASRVTTATSTQPLADPLLPLEETRRVVPSAEKPVHVAHTGWGSPMPAGKTTEVKRTTVLTSTPRAEPLTAKAEPLLPEKEAQETIATSTQNFQISSHAKEIVIQETKATAPAVQPARPSLFASLFHPGASPAKPQPMPQGRPIIPDRPYVTTGTVIFHDAPVASSAAALPSPDALHRTLVQACGNRVKGVQVQTRPDGDLHVTLKVTSESSIESLTGIVLHLPEMQSSQVHLSCEIVP